MIILEKNGISEMILNSSVYYKIFTEVKHSMWLHGKEDFGIKIMPPKYITLKNSKKTRKISSNIFVMSIFLDR